MLIYIFVLCLIDGKPMIQGSLLSSSQLAHMSPLKHLARPLQRLQPFVSSTNHKLFIQRPIHRTRNLSTSTTSRASLASSLPTQPTVVLYHPNHAEIEKEELEVDLLPPEQVKIDITDRAAAVRVEHIVSAPP